MKALLIFILSILVCSCSTPDRKPCAEVNRDVCDEYGVKLVEFTIEGKTHQYVNYSLGKFNNGICHYPECKYCNNK